MQLYKHGLAYKKEMNVNWCTSCKVVLANEEVVNGCCERCGGEVVHKVKSQWMLKITAYADRLIDDLDGLDFIDRVVTQQKNWIGRSHGAEVTFKATTGDDLVVYTTRPDTLFGATYMVLAPEPVSYTHLEGNHLRRAGTGGGIGPCGPAGGDPGDRRERRGQDHQHCKAGKAV